MRGNVLKTSLFLILTACAGQSQPQITGEATKCKPSESSVKKQGAALADPIAQVTFYGDLLPILESQTDGKVYKCTTCHADMAKPDALNTVDKVNRAIESMENGRMPRPGDHVPADKIELFRIWQLQGFQEGVKNSAKPVSPPTSTGTSSATSSNTSTSTSNATNSGACP